MKHAVLIVTNEGLATMVSEVEESKMYGLSIGNGATKIPVTDDAKSTLAYRNIVSMPPQKVDSGCKIWFLSTHEWNELVDKINAVVL